MVSGELSPNFGDTNTMSGQANDGVAYYTADGGYEVLQGTNYKAGGFMSWPYYAQTSDWTGCAKVVSRPCVAPGDRIMGPEATDWSALRVGLSAGGPPSLNKATMLAEESRLKLAVLPDCKNFSAGLGGRYWAMSTEEHSDGTGNGSVCFRDVSPVFAFAKQRWVRSFGPPTD